MRGRRPKLLVTAFGPFPTMPRNPSAVIARLVASDPRWRLLGVDVEVEVLTTAYRCLDAELAPALARKPDAVLMIGVAGRAKRIRIEARATARRSVLFPDAEGMKAERPSGSHAAVLRTPLSPTKLLLALKRHGLAPRASRDAGRYLCNAAYHHALATGLPAVFVHIPKELTGTRPRERGVWRVSPRSRLAAALVESARLLLREGRLGTGR